MKLSFKQRIFTYFFLLFSVFTLCVVVLEQKEEKKHKTEELILTLNDYANLVHNKVKLDSVNNINQLTKLLPIDIRITILNIDGLVLYDKEVEDIGGLENHTNRPEIKSARYTGKGNNIRQSASTQQEYLYYANRYDDYYVRVALPYNVDTKALLQTDNYFIYTVIAIFLVMLMLINYMANRFGKSIKKLQQFTSLVKNDKLLPREITFPEDELGAIGSELVAVVNEREKALNSLKVEQEKMIRHFDFAEEGFAIFTSTLQKSYVNTHFIRYVNYLSDRPIVAIEEMFQSNVFSPIVQFINDKNRVGKSLIFKLNNGGKTFRLQTIVYTDQSFEIGIKDITQTEQNQLLKQELTSNVAHELRTPITSLRGYLETLSEQNLPNDKKQQFIDRAHQQSIRLSNLIQDISLISKIEGSSFQFDKEDINLSQLLDDIRISLSDRLDSNRNKLEVKIEPHITVKGNYTLLYSIFANLIENSINYAGTASDIIIELYLEKENILYFRYYDTGIGVPEKDLERLFERFYRPSEGRTRNSGGSGLGLSIVRHAIAFHQGQIMVRNRKEGGLEFLFELKQK